MEENQIANFKVVIVGGSAGSLEVLMKVLPQLKPISKFALIFVLHRKSAEDNTLEQLIAMKTIIPVKHVEDKTPLLPGFIYVAPSDYHLLFETHHELSLDTSEKVNYSRPSIDVSFESAAGVYGSLLTGVLLSGANADGAYGLRIIKQHGGKVVVQDPATADMPFMPQSALNSVTPDFVLGVEELLHFINNMK